MSSFNGSGTFVISGTGLPYVTNTTISSTVGNQLNTDLASGLSNVICKDGQTVITNDIPWAGFKITGLGAPATTGDALSYGQSAGPLTATTLAINGATLGSNKFAVSGNSFFSGAFGVSNSSGSPTIFTFTNVGVGQAAIQIRGNNSGNNLELLTGSTGQTIIADNALTISASSLTISPATTLSAALTYGGVTLSNSVSGTGSMVLNTTPIFAGKAAFNTTAGGWSTFAQLEALSTAANFALSAYNNGSTSGAGALLGRVDSTAVNLATFFYTTSQIGSIFTNGSTTTYGTTSDYRVKNISGSYSDAGAIIDAIPIHLGSYKNVLTQQPLFLAHELQDAGAGFAVFGEKDGEKMQQFDPAMLLPLLMAALKETRAEVAALKAA